MPLLPSNGPERLEGDARGRLSAPWRPPRSKLRVHQFLQVQQGCRQISGGAAPVRLASASCCLGPREGHGASLSGFQADRVVEVVVTGTTGCVREVHAAKSRIGGPWPWCRDSLASLCARETWFWLHTPMCRTDRCAHVRQGCHSCGGRPASRPKALVCPYSVQYVSLAAGCATGWLQGPGTALGLALVIPTERRRGLVTHPGAKRDWRAPWTAITSGCCSSTV